MEQISKLLEFLGFISIAEFASMGDDLVDKLFHDFLGIVISVLSVTLAVVLLLIWEKTKEYMFSGFFLLYSDWL